MPDDPPEIGFEAALTELSAIVAELEGGGPDLSAALDRYARGVQLLNRCQTLLDGAERSVSLLAGVSANGEPETAPFDASATAVTVAATPAVASPPPPEPAKPRKSPKTAAPAPASNPSPSLLAWEPTPPDDPENPGPPW